MRIALVSEFFYPTLGGIQECLYSLCKQFVEMGHEPVIVTPTIVTDQDIEDWWPTDLPRRCYQPMGYSLPFFINGSLGRTGTGFFLGTKLKKLLSAEHFDIVHLHSPMNGTLPILANHYATIPVVGTFHTSFTDSTSFRIFKKIGQRHIDRLSHVMAVAPISLRSIQKFFNVEGQVITNGIDTKTFRPDWEGPSDKLAQLNDGRLNILFIGRPEPRNGLDTLIRAFHEVHKVEPNARLVVAGGGNLMPKYVSLASSLAGESIVFLGPVRSERPQIYRAAHIHVFGVEKAAFSLTVLEGLASGLPLITTNFEGHRDHGTPGQHFLTTPFGDVEALTKELLYLIRNPARRDELGRAARAHSLAFDWSVIAGKYMKVYERVLSEK